MKVRALIAMLENIKKHRNIKLHLKTLRDIEEGYGDETEILYMEGDKIHWSTKI